MRTRPMVATCVVAAWSCVSCVGDRPSLEGRDDEGGSDIGGDTPGGGDDGDGDGSGGGGGGGGGGGEVTCTEVALEPSCTTSWYADEECDPANNLPECEWDGGDCCASTCEGEDCGSYGYECRDPGAGGGGVPSPAL